MKKEIKEYFDEQYGIANFTVVPGHWPDFKNKKQVDKWIKMINSIIESFNE